MIVTTTATTSTTATPSSTLPMSLSSLKIHSNPTSPPESVASPSTPMQPFAPRQCLFCPNSSPTFTNAVIHMQKSHGLFIPHQEHLVVDLETLFEYLHLIIFGYRECIHCGTQRATVQAVQQHMTSKGHCKIDILEQGSEFSEFYDFSAPEDDAESESESHSDGMNQEVAPKSSQQPLVADEDSIRLPSGKIISRQPPMQTRPSFTQSRRRTRASASQLEYSVGETDVVPKGEGTESDMHETQLLSKREKRESATVAYRMANMSANDRASLIHLSAAEQRSLLAVQHRHTGKVQREERRRQGKIDRKGNKNLYAYWHTETPVYQCG